MNLDARAERRSEYFGKAERRELEMFPERMEREKERWLDLVDFPTWQILKILQFGDQHVRGILKFFLRKSRHLLRQARQDGKVGLDRG